MDKQETLDLIESVRSGAEEIRELDNVQGYAAEDYVDEAIESLNAAYDDVQRGE